MNQNPSASLFPVYWNHIYECINLEFAFLCCKEMSGRHPFQK